MFKKLKEKITEEVKSSPQRFQQLTQSVSDRLQNSSTSDENFFSIGEDDSSVNTEPGFTSVSLMSPQDSRNRRSSTSSLASDVSFLPRYDPTGSMYHLQSDLDISASEIEDNVSTSSIGHLTKEQIYAAFQKAQMRYHKYRGRYSDLAKHYKDLERENSKMKSVLVETQDKAIRRVTELKEQCSLEQKAKAHLESALRDEIDEKNFKIQSLETKIELLQNSPTQNQESEIDNLNEKIQELKANNIIYKNKISNLENEIVLFSQREKENNLSLAQNKMELHNELLNKDKEISKLKQEIESLKNNKVENLQLQNKKLIEKIESLTQKCNTFESDLLKMDFYKKSYDEAKENIEELEKTLEMVREEAKKNLLGLEVKIRDKVQKEFDEKSEEMKKDFEEKLTEFSAVDVKNYQLVMIQKDEELKTLKGGNDALQEELQIKNVKYKELESNHLELVEDCVKLRSQIAVLEKEVAGLKNNEQNYELKIKRLEKEIEDFRKKDETENLLVKIEKLEQELNKKDDEVKKFEEICKKLKFELEDSKKVGEELNEAKKSLKNFEEEVLTLRESCITLKENEENWKEKMKNFEKVVEELNEAKKSLKIFEEEVLTLQQTCKKLKEEKEKSKSELETFGKVVEELNESKNQLKKFEEEVLTLRESCKTLKENEENWKEKMKNFENVVEELNEAKKSLKNFEEEVLTLQQTCKKLKEEKEKSKSELETFGKVVEELNESKNQLKKFEEEVLTLRESCKTLKENEENWKEKMKNFQKVVEELNEAKNSLKNSEEELLTLQQTCKRLKEEGEKSRFELENYRKEIATSEKIGEELNEAKKLLKNFEEEMLTLQQMCKRLKEEEEKAKSELEMETLEKVNNSKEVSTLQEACKRLQEEIIEKEEEYETKLANHEEKVNQLWKKFEDFNTFLKRRNSDLLDIFKGSVNNLNHVENHKKMLNLEEKLQSFDDLFSIEKDNFVKIFSFLKKLEGEYSLLVLERNKLLTEKQESLDKMSKNVNEELLLLKEENAKLAESMSELELRNTQITSDRNYISDENSQLIAETEKLKIENEEMEKKLIEAQSSIKENEEKEKLLSEYKLRVFSLEKEVEELKSAHNEELNKEIENLRTKLVQYKSLDLTNRSSIDFYENELQKLKTQNEKLNRKLDETLVTLNHCSELANSTEIEYLKNVLYNYMLGKESLVLARVIAAVCKFDPHQTEMILAKEQQKQTLLGQLGIL